MEASVCGIVWMLRGACGPWEDWQIALTQTTDFLITLAYISIPVSVALIAWSLREQMYGRKRITALFCAFVFSCGMTHIFDLLAWHYTHLAGYPVYLWAMWVKSVCAAVSVAAAAVYLSSISKWTRTLKGYSDDGRAGT